MSSDYLGKVHASRSSRALNVVSSFRPPGPALAGWAGLCILLLYVLPERDYVMFGSLLSQIRLSVVCLSVTLVHPTHGVEAFGKISSPLCMLVIL